MGKIVTPEGAYVGWIEAIRHRRYCARLLLDDTTLLCEVERDKEASPDGQEHRAPNEPVRVGHIVFEVDSCGEATLHGDFLPLDAGADRAA